jgi:hypothetical protein
MLVRKLISEKDAWKISNFEKNRKISDINKVELFDRLSAAQA